jgi:parallel beta-helix repeat protein
MLVSVLSLPIWSEDRVSWATSHSPAFFNVKDYGAVGDGVTDDTLSIRSAMKAMVNGGILFFPEGSYRLKQQGTEKELLLFERYVRILGAGLKSVLLVDSTVPNDVDVIELSPNIGEGYHGWYWAIDSITVTPKSGTPARHAVHIDIEYEDPPETLFRSFKYMAKLAIENNIFGPFGGHGIALSNEKTALDGFFTSVIQNNVVHGGIYLPKAGDSLNIFNNTITGNNIGVDLSLVPGAAHLVIAGNNITSKKGGIKITSGSQIKILDNTIAQNTSNDAPVGQRDMIQLLGQPGFGVSNVEVTGNLLNGSGSTYGLENVITVDNASDIRIRNNTIHKGIGTDIEIGTNAFKTVIGYNNAYNVPLTQAVSDSGSSTIGVMKAASLQSSWIQYDAVNYSSAGYVKDSNGTVHLKGVIKGGSTTMGALLFTLPAEYRPKKVVKFVVSSADSGGPIKGEINITESGAVSIIYGGNAYLSLDNISFTTK